MLFKHQNPIDKLMMFLVIRRMERNSKSSCSHTLQRIDI